MSNIIIRHLTGTHKGKDQVITSQEVSLGTGPGNTVRLDPVWDKGVSPSHARIFRDAAGQWTLEDAGSSTGTFVNGQRLTLKQRVSGSLVIELGNGGPKIEIILPPALPASASHHVGGGSRSAGRLVVIAASLAVLGIAAWIIASKAGGDTDQRIQQTAKRYEQAVGVVIKATEGDGSPYGTAWAVAPHTFATNSHITDMLEPVLASGGSAFVVINKHPEMRYRVTKVITHPNYYSTAKIEAEAAPRLNIDGKPESVAAYDVGLLVVDGDPPVKMTLASKAKLHSLDSGHRVAFLGFPMENLKSENIDMHYPVATMQSGIITSVTDAWMARATPENSILIHHNLPSAGGASGSPVFDADGDVVGLHSAGNYTMGVNLAVGSAIQANVAQEISKLKQQALKLLKNPKLSDEEQANIKLSYQREVALISGLPAEALMRVTSASLINFAQRVDLLKELLAAQGVQATEGKP